MHDSVKESEVGKYLDRLIVQDATMGGKGFDAGSGGNIIQQLWRAFMSGAGKAYQSQGDDVPTRWDPE